MKHRISIISEEVFFFSLITYLLLLISESLKEGFVIYFFNLDLLLAIVLISGVITALTLEIKEPPSTKNNTPKLNWRISYFIAFGIFFLVYYKTEELGGISLTISILTSLFIMLVSNILLHPNSD